MPGRGSVGVLVLSGSSGRVELDRCRVLEEHGATARSIRWFGGPGQPPGICELPLETFTAELDLLAERCDRLAVLGVSKGAEAALLVGLRDARVRAVVALAPTPVVWANVGPGLDGEVRPQRSSWTWHGEALPFVPYDDDAQPVIGPVGAPPSFLGVYEQSLRTHADAVPAARIPVEDLDAELVLVAGGDDLMWPSVRFVEEIAASRQRSGRRTHLVTHADAGHRCRLPGEEPLPPSTVNAHGGTPEADSELGRRAWPVIAAVLGLTG